MSPCVVDEQIFTTYGKYIEYSELILKDAFARCAEKVNHIRTFVEAKQAKFDTLTEKQVEEEEEKGTMVFK